MKIREYIESGVLESYVLGSASAAETHELLQLKKQYPEIEDALFELETDLERIAQHMSIPPPPGLLAKIEDGINGLINIPDEISQKRERESDHRRYDFGNRNQFIEVESESSHMRIHKNWKWVLAGVFLLGKMFLIGAIFYYLENRQAQEQIQQLKTELKQYSIHK